MVDVSVRKERKRNDESSDTANPVQIVQAPRTGNDPVLLNFKLAIVNTVMKKIYTQKSAHAYLEAMEVEHILQDGRKVRYDVKTMERWVRKFRDSGEDPFSLDKQVRQDKGTSRKLPAIALQKIAFYLEKAPNTSSAVILDTLTEEHIIEPNGVSVETIRRAINDNNLRPAYDETDERIRHQFIMDNVGDMWQADTCYYIKIPLVNKTGLHWVYIQGIMDDHSRVIVAARCYMEDTAENFRKTLKYAIEHHHIPTMLVVDNGGPYIDNDLFSICNKLGIALVHTRSNDGTGKGALERWWRSIQGWTMLQLVLNPPQTLEEVQQIVDNWVNKYHQRLNTGINAVPMERYLASIARHPVRKPSSLEWLREQFYLVVVRHVRCTAVQLWSKRFRVPDELAREKKVTIRYDSDDPEGTLHIFHKGKRYPIKEDDRSANAREKRNTGGRKAELKEKAEAKKAARKAPLEAIPEIPLSANSMTLEEERAEKRYERRMAGTPLLQSNKEDGDNRKNSMMIDLAYVSNPISSESKSETPESSEVNAEATATACITEIGLDFSVLSWEE